LIESASDGLDRIAMCEFFLEHFGRSPRASRVLLAMAQEADRAATTLSRRARKRLAKLDEESPRDYYLNDPGLDRYSKLRVKFDFNPSTTEYVYNGQAYREIIKRFPASDEAKRARQRLDRAEQKLARQ
jgi:N-acyl-D-aspartate/D-glutamate deacylase